MRHALLLCLPLVLTACASTPVGILYTDVKVARAYRSPTPNEVEVTNNDPVATGQSCNRGILGLVAWGDGGYQEAVADAVRGQANDKILYDVKSDVDATAILGIVYQETCTRVTGKVGSLKTK